jgi:ribonucleoside-diphosphate reductase alpha chain
MKITKIEKNIGAVALDFEVPDIHSYLLKDNILSHNSIAGILSYSKDEDKKENNNGHSKKTLRPEYVERGHAPKRPKDLECDIHQISVNKKKHIVLIGKLNGSLYEVFVTKNQDEKMDINHHKNGIIRKEKKGHYTLIVKNGEERCIVNNIGKSFDNIYASLSRFISMSLRHGVPLQFIIDQLQKDSNFVSFEKVVSRVLKKYIKEGEKVMSNQKCPECGSELIYRDGCLSCPQCGWSKCS